MRKTREEKLKETRAFFGKTKTKLDSPIKKEWINKATFFFLLYITIQFIAKHPYSFGEYTGAEINSLFRWFFFIQSRTLGIVHEGGHGVCYLTISNQYITALFGTLFQIGIPYLIVLYFRKLKEGALENFFLFITGLSVQYTAWYISTTHLGKTVSASRSFLGQEGSHDFYVMLEPLGLVDFDMFIANIVRLIAFYLMFKALYKLYLISFEKKD